jgi:hypothetical protein
VNSMTESLRAIWPLTAGLVYFALLCVAVEIWVVRRRRLTEYQLRLVDVAWASTSAIQLAFLILSVREGTLRDAVDRAEGHSAAIRQAYREKMRVGTEECMAGTWPRGAVKGLSYRENGNMVTDACAGVSSLLDYSGRFFDDDELWRRSPSVDSAALWESRYADTFVTDFGRRFTHLFDPPRRLDPLTVRAKAELETQARSLVSLKWEAGRTAFAKGIVHTLASFGVYWPIAVAMSLAFSLGKSRIALQDARRKREPAVAIRANAAQAGGDHDDVEQMQHAADKTHDAAVGEE